jgi:hypothetical protein
MRAAHLRPDPRNQLSGKSCTLDQAQAAKGAPIRRSTIFEVIGITSLIGAYVRAGW